nr:2,3-bisphosphoglycerate-dependent phosphoglycerate mutase [Methylobacterium sp. BE186]
MPSPSDDGALTLTERTLVLVRHGQSTDNERNLFSGLRNPDLTDRGVAEAVQAGRQLKGLGFVFDLAFTSELIRAQRTLTFMLAELGQTSLNVEKTEALNERDYGELAGLNKQEARDRWSSQQVQLWRKSYDAVPPGGESLVMTAERLVPYYVREIEPQVRAGKRTLVVAHGNSLRALVMHLDGLSAQEVVDVHLATSQKLVYRFDEHGAVTKKQSILVDI